MKILISPRVKPENIWDALITTGVLITQIIVLYVLPGYFAYKLFSSFIATAIVVALVYFTFSSLVVKQLEIDENGISLIRRFGNPKYVSWTDVTEVVEVSPFEIVLFGWLLPPIPAHEMTPSFTSMGHYKIKYNGDYFYYPPEDGEEFEKVVAEYRRFA